MLEREINKINKKIDVKILKGQDYKREARDHKLLLRKVRYHTMKKGLLEKAIDLLFRTDLNKINIYA